jgi:hypothetical protein
MDWLNIYQLSEERLLFSGDDHIIDNVILKHNVLGDINCYFSVPTNWWHKNKYGADHFISSKLEDYDPESVLIHIRSGFKIKFGILLEKLRQWPNGYNPRNGLFQRIIHFIFIDSDENYCEGRRISFSEMRLELNLQVFLFYYASNNLACASFIRSRGDTYSKEDMSTNPNDYGATITHEKSNLKVSAEDKTNVPHQQRTRVLTRKEFMLYTMLPEEFYDFYLHDWYNEN